MLASLMPAVDKPDISSALDDALAQVGIPLPSDYCAFLETFGSGVFCDIEIAGLGPVSRLRIAELVQHKHDEAQSKDRMYRPPFFPERLGLIPWGRTLDGYTCCWGPSGFDLDAWGVAVVDPGDRYSFAYYPDLSFSSFLLRYCGHGDLLQLQLRWRDLWRGEVTFTPDHGESQSHEDETSRAVAWAPLVALAGTARQPVTLVEVKQAPATVPTTEQSPAGALPLSPRRPGPLQELFRHGTDVVLATGEQATVETFDVGHLRMPTGALVAADPWQLGWTAGLTLRVEPGTYPVTISVARVNDDRPLVLASRMQISQHPVYSWEMALRPGEDPRLLVEEEYYGFSVDSGMACLVDAAAAGAGATAIERGGFDFFQVVQARKYAVIELPDDAANIIVFPSGMGDGSYPVWIGRNADGEAACIVTDLLATAQADAQD